MSCLPCGKGHKRPFHICVHPHFCDPCGKIFPATRHGQCGPKRRETYYCAVWQPHKHATSICCLAHDCLTVPGTVFTILHWVCSKVIFPVDYFQLANQAQWDIDPVSTMDKRVQRSSWFSHCRCSAFLRMWSFQETTYMWLINWACEWVVFVSTGYNFK